MCKTALVLGSSGLTGSLLLKALINDKYFNKIYVLNRKSINNENSKIHEIIIDFDSDYSSLIPRYINIVFCCLGSTIKKAKTKENFHKVDFGYISKFAFYCKKNKVTDFHLISSIGASEKSLFFYQKTKGETERFVENLNFETCFIYRPSVIYGNRSDFRLGEAFAAWVSRNFAFLFLGSSKRILAVDAVVLADKMISMSKLNLIGKYIVESEDIRRV